MQALFLEAGGGMALQLIPWLVQALLQSPANELTNQRWVPPPQAATTILGGGGGELGGEGDAGGEGGRGGEGGTWGGHGGLCGCPLSWQMSQPDLVRVGR